MPQPCSGSTDRTLSTSMSRLPGWRGAAVSGMHSSRRTRGIALAGAEVNRGGIITASMDTSARSPARRVALFLLGYGAAGGLLIAALRWMEYRFLVVEHSLEIYGGLVAAVFAALGIWLGT